MPSAPLPADETGRLRALDAYDVLDSVPEPPFDDLAQLASQLCSTPIAFVSLVDAQRQWFKASIGTDMSETPRSVSFCAHAILEDDVFVIEDAATDPRFSDNPLVVDGPRFRFYAGTQLRAKDGHALGTLCVLDRVSRTLRPEQSAALRMLGRQVEAQLELRKTIRTLAIREQRLSVLRAEGDQMRAFLVHDLKNMLATVIPNAEYLCDECALEGEGISAANDIRESSKRMLEMVVRQLDDGQDVAGIVAKPESLNLELLVEDVVRGARRRAEERGKTLTMKVGAANQPVVADCDLLRRVIGNLIENAVKHAGPNASRIVVESNLDETGGALIRVSDDGIGIAANNRKRILTSGARLGAGESGGGSGLGIAFCRAAVEAHYGRLWIEHGQPHGAVFCIWLPPYNQKSSSR